MPPGALRQCASATNELVKHVIHFRTVGHNSKSSQTAYGIQSALQVLFV